MSTPKPHQITPLFLAAAVILLLLAPGLGALAVPESDTPLIRLQYATFDPLQGGPAVPVYGQGAGAPEGSSLQIIQFSGPVQEAWKAAIEAAGGRLYGYIPDYAFLARLDPAAAAAISALPYVRWIGPYYPAYRLADSLRATVEAGESGPVEVKVQALPDADLGALEALVQSLGGSLSAEAANEFAVYLRLSLPAGQVQSLAALDEVVWVEPYFEMELLNDKGGGEIMKANAVSAALNLTGGGQVVGVADSGLDSGNLNTLHTDVRGRVKAAYCLGITSPCDWSDYVSHGTHVVGSVLGNGTASGGTYKGVAPQAQLVFQGVGDALGGLNGIPDDNGNLMRNAYGDGARIHTNSWGGSTGGAANPYGGYVISSQQVDQAMWEHKDMLVLFAAGNSGEDANANGLVDPDSIGQPGTAKNVLTVGASENNRPALNFLWGNAYGPPISTDKRADNPSGMAAFSSRGPTDDGRIKPDIVAPGTFIASLRTQQSAFKDNLEGSTADYDDTLTQNGGTGDSWQLVTDDPHSPSHYWKETVSGSFNPDALTALFTPLFDVRATGGVFDVHFWHKYNLSSNDELVVILLNPDTMSGVSYALPVSGSTGAYSLESVTFSLGSFGYEPAAVRIGFGIRSDGSSNSSWWLDDIRVDGADWGRLSSTGLAQPGDTLDESYLMMGGTSMATPLTAGAAALTREWLIERRGFSNPSAALMKAALINGAADMSPGQYSSPQEVPAQRPNNVTGWGRVDLQASLNPLLPRQVWLQDTTAGLSTGGQASYTIKVGNLSGAQSEPAASEVSEDSYADSALTEAASTPQPPETAPRQVTLALAGASTGQPSSSVATAPLVPQASVNLVLDDGSYEDSMGLVDTGLGVSYQFIWLNRFTPAASEFPFNLEQIQVLFDGGGDVQTGDDIDLAVYQDSDGNPANGATLLRVINETVKADDGVTWSVYNLASPVLVSGPGDVLIAVINRYVVDGVSPTSYPAAIDQTSDLNRSWIGWWLSIPPDPPVLPPDYTFDLIGNLASTGGNWLVRGYGTTVSATPSPTPVTPTPSGTPPTPTTTPPPVQGGPLRITLAWTDYPGSTFAAKALVNDLDLEVIAPNGTHYYGNAGLYTSGQCFRASQWDACNNVEGVLIPSALYGNYTILVHGYNIPNGPQPFAVAASGDSLLGGTSNLNKKVFLPMQRK